jgi:caspase-like apoptosis-related cysteine protease
MFLISSFIIFSVAKEDHSDADCLLVTLLTHGETSMLVYAHDLLYNVEDLWSPFTAEKYLSLAGKPKIFIIQVSEFFIVIFIMWHGPKICN